MAGNEPDGKCPCCDEPEFYGGECGYCSYGKDCSECGKRRECDHICTPTKENTDTSEESSIMAHPTHPGMTIDQLQASYTELGLQISNAAEEQHQICDELMDRADKAASLTDQTKVDWAIVRDALSDAVNNAEGEMPGDTTIAHAFEKNGLLVVHRDDAAAINPQQ